MRKFAGCAALLLLGLLSGCLPGPPFASVAASLPSPAAGAARVFFYRWYEPYETLTPTVAYLNGNRVGVAEPGAVLYRDVPAGQYLIAVDSDLAFPNQFKTVALKPGDTLYARIDSLQSWSGCEFLTDCPSTFAVSIIDPAQALGEMQRLRFIQG